MKAQMSEADTSLIKCIVWTHTCVHVYGVECISLVAVSALYKVVRDIHMYMHMHQQ